MDSSGKGCQNRQQRDDPAVAPANQCGLRDPTNFWDYYDVNHDCAVNINDDVLAVAQAFGDRNGPNYTLDKDRTYIGPNNWNVGPPDGYITNPVDILRVAQQVGHNCGPRPAPSDYTTYYTYDAENRLASKVEGGVTTSYYYDAQGALAKKVDGTGTTLYVENLYEKQLATGQETKYYWFGGRRIAMRQAGTLQYLLTDHLGSTRVALDTTGSLVSSTRYYSYGRTRTTAGTPLTDKLFTGQQAEGSIYYMKARFYDPLTGRFLSPDTTDPNYEYVQSLNRYSYVMNNPLRYTDPTGRCGYDPTNSELNNLLGMCGPGTMNTLTGEPTPVVNPSAVPDSALPPAATASPTPPPVPPSTGTPGPPLTQSSGGCNPLTCVGELLQDVGSGFQDTIRGGVTGLYDALSSLPSNDCFWASAGLVDSSLGFLVAAAVGQPEFMYVFAATGYFSYQNYLKSCPRLFD